MELNGFGPRMTITELTTKVAVVEWCNTNGEPFRNQYPLASLMLVDMDKHHDLRELSYDANMAQLKQQLIVRKPSFR